MKDPEAHVASLTDKQLQALNLKVSKMILKGGTSTVMTRLYHYLRLLITKEFQKRGSRLWE